MSRIGDRAFATLQYVLPKHLMSRAVYALMRSEKPWLRRKTLSTFLGGYRVDMSDAVEQDPYAYRHFNAFFTRALRPDARPIDRSSDAFVSPVDGTVSQSGVIDDERIFQAKGQTYSLIELLGGDVKRAQRYRGGSFATIYLAPYNYHRIHMPFDGVVAATTYIPGDLFSVNASTARTVPRLFARNERVICDFDNPRCAFAMAYIGALHVGSMETTWCGEINPPPRIGKRIVDLTEGLGTSLAKGQESGRFNMGSTVVIVTEPGKVKWSSSMVSGATLKMGERIGVVS